MSYAAGMDTTEFPQVMVAMARQRALPELLHAITDGIAHCGRVALVRIWLLAPGDVCESCRFRSECPDRARCLHLVASAGNPADGKTDLGRLDGAFRRFPLGVRKIGRVALQGEPMLLSGIAGDEAWIADREWWGREGVRSFAAQPLVFRGETMGVLGIFDRGLLDARDFEWLRVFADHAAVSIANARAFEEIGILRARLEEENAYLREEVTSVLGDGALIGDSLGLRKVVRQIELVAPTDATVLITGESGTGKELVARAIHEHGARATRPLIKVNCGAVAETLFESEFFGHVRGAFTGAIQDRLGRFELAHGGSIFLDEIGDVPPALQAKLLRVLQEGELERVGDARTRKVDVRVIAATHRDLRRDAKAGRFREDLFYRLSVFPIEVPPLRERREDIAPLVLHFVRRTAERMNRSVPRVSRATLERFAAQDWPGNLRELQNAIERAVILSRGGALRFEELGVTTSPAPAVVAESPVLRTRAELKRQERESIQAALTLAGGRIFGAGGAAQLLGMPPTTLASRCKALGLRGGAGPVAG